jgi:catechol 2,3-dioxygenase-like lactoylglutathione lyase family enzyme
MKTVLAAGVFPALMLLQTLFAPAADRNSTAELSPLELGNFSVSLAVKDLNKSKEFYEKLGFKVIAGAPAGKFLILQNETATIGLFEGLFEKNILTFNPGWDRNSKTLKEFSDVRDIQKTLVERGLTLVTKADEASTGPASLLVIDPDGNPVLIDQHVAKPEK